MPQISFRPPPPKKTAKLRLVFANNRTLKLQEVLIGTYKALTKLNE